MNTQTNVMPVKKSFIGWIVVVGLVLILGSWIVGSYNSLVTSNQGVDTQWAQVENQLQRRFDLVPNLVNTVKGITKQELDVFKSIADARTRYAGAQTQGVDAKVNAANEYQSALGRLLVITENYPQLLSSQSFRDLSAELAGTENRIAVERGRFNEAVGGFNVKVKTFPSNLFAGMFGFGPRELFKVEEVEKVVPNVNFN